MSFDENPPSSDKLVDPHKRTTKVNLGMAFGVVAFLLIGIAFVVYFAMRND